MRREHASLAELTCWLAGPQILRVPRAARWKALAARHGFEVFRHSHGFLFGARGRLAGLEVTAAEDSAGVSLEVPALPLTEETVVCDQQFYDWCRQPVQAERHDGALSWLQEGRRSLWSRLRRGRGAAVDPALAAAIAPHRVPAVRPATGNPAFDRRFYVLFPGPALLGSPQVVDAILALPPFVEVHVLRGCLRATLRDTEFSADLWNRFLILTQAATSVARKSSG